jgi:parallel beta-helix repeat protein
MFETHRWWTGISALAALCQIIIPMAVNADYLNPSGPPGSAQTQMRTLNEVEPHLVIDSLPVTITNGGSYILTGNLTGSNGMYGITISASDVTINLNGFSLIGATGSHNGIVINGNRQQIYIRNGTIRGWGGYAVSAGTAINSRYEDLLISSNGYFDSVNALYAGANSIVERCTFLNNRYTGGYVSDGCKIENCISRNNNGYGFFSGKNSIIRNCTATDNVNSGFRTTDNSVVTDCNAVNNGNNGFYTLANTTVTSCSSSSNAYDGFNVGHGCVVAYCTAMANSNGFNIYDGTVIKGCAAYANTADGIHSWSMANIQDCSGTDNGNDGIDATDGSIISGCLVSGQTGSGNAGIRAGTYCRVVNNICRNNYYGIYAAGKAYVSDNSVSLNSNGVFAAASGKCVVIRNYAVDNSVSDYSLQSGNVAGSDTTNTGTITNVSPWANFSY